MTKCMCISPGERLTFLIHSLSVNRTCLLQCLVLFWIGSRSVDISGWWLMKALSCTCCISWDLSSSRSVMIPTDCTIPSFAICCFLYSEWAITITYRYAYIPTRDAVGCDTIYVCTCIIMRQLSISEFRLQWSQIAFAIFSAHVLRGGGATRAHELDDYYPLLSKLMYRLLASTMWWFSEKYSAWSWMHSRAI